MKENNVPKKIDIEITIEFDKEIMEKVKKKQKYLPYTSGFMLLSFFYGSSIWFSLSISSSFCEHVHLCRCSMHSSVYLVSYRFFGKKGREGHLPSSYASDLISCHSTMFPW